MENQTNLILAVVISLLVLIGFQYYEARVHPPPPAAQTQPSPGQAASAVSPPASGAGTAAAPASSAAAGPEAPSPRIAIVTPSVKGSLALRGARFDDLTLLKYRETTDPASPAITLLDPSHGTGAYFAEFGWVPNDPAVKVPDADTLWTASAQTLTPASPVTLTWDNGAGLRFERRIAIDDDYMFTITDSVANSSAQPVTMHPYGLVARWGTPPTLNYYILHEGPLGVFNGTLKDGEKYSSLKSDKLVLDKSKGGWIGFTDKYWLTALAPDQAQDIDYRMTWRDEANLDRYQTDWTGPAMNLAAGATISEASHFFAGAKELSTLDGYSDSLGIPKLGLAIDFGWFWFLTIPFFKFLNFIHEHVPNFGVSILIFTVVIRGAFFPIANKSYQMMNKMRMLQPEVKKLQARFADDRARLNQETMALYKREKANPMAGCLPIALQIPVFFALYKVLFVTIEMRQQPFFGWIHDLSQPDPTWLITGFGLFPWDVPSFLSFLEIGLWPIIMGCTLWAQQKFNPQPTDPTQAKIFAFMPIIFTFMLGRFPAGLVIYWSWSNTLSIAQQWVIRKRMAAAEAKKKRA